MKGKILICFVIILVTTIGILQNFDTDDDLKILIDKSGPYIGTDYAFDLGFDGTGITIAIIDTGVDFNHPDLAGFESNGKIAGGYDFVDNDDIPNDTAGHGTQVAGILVAEGNLTGIAPKSKIFVYRVSDTGEAVSSELIVKAIERAIQDEVDIINISLGINKTNAQIDKVVNKAVKNGIVVVSAAGNDGPGLETIGSPGRNANSITVGATYNNITSSLVATLQVDGKQFSVLPMIGTSSLETPIIGQVIFGEYGRERDLKELDVVNSILLVERGSDNDEIVYFSNKETNAAEHGAQALIVYNNIDGIYFGELYHKFNKPDYIARIPVASISRDDGLELRKMLDEEIIAEFNTFNNPDFVAHYSSRGPVSPFYIKPDLVAPGSFINTTLIDGKYNLTSGTSFAAPHVSGAVALLLQKNPQLTPADVKSILVTTSDIVTDSYDNEFSFADAGAGRVNITKALNADIIISPSHLIFHLSSNVNEKTEVLKLDGNLDDLKVDFVGNDVINFDYTLNRDNLEIKISLDEELSGEYEGRIFIEDNKIKYQIPVLVLSTISSVSVTESNGQLFFEIDHPDRWSYTKIVATNQESGKKEITSITPTKNKPLEIFDAGKYWIEATISTENDTFDAFSTIDVQTTTEKKPFDLFYTLQIPQKPFIIILIFIAVIILVGLKIRKS